MSGWNKKGEERNCWDDSSSRQSGEIPFLNLGKRTMIVDVMEKEGRMKGGEGSFIPPLIFKECVRNP